VTSAKTESATIRVEHALRLLPDVDVLAPLRALVIASSRANTSDAPHATVGKRVLRTDRLPDAIPKAVQHFSEHLTSLFTLAISALDAERRGDLSAAVRSLLEAGGLEARIGREQSAEIWIEHALRLAESSIDRRAEIEALLAYSALDVAREAPERAARRCQRAFALAEAERLDSTAAEACLALGGIALRRGNLQGASSWYARGLELALADHSAPGRLRLGLSELATARGALDEAAEFLRLADAELREARDWAGLAAARSAMARLSAAAGRPDETIVHYREALEHAQRGARDPLVELVVRINLSRFLLESDRLVEAEDEARKAEEIAVLHNRTRKLVRLYIILGTIRGKQLDESGFVFFEKAIELSRGASPTPRLEAEAYHAYALFRRSFSGDEEEAAAYLEREEEILALVETDGAPDL